MVVVILVLVAAALSEFITWMNGRGWLTFMIPWIVMLAVMLLVVSFALAGPSAFIGGGCCFFEKSLVGYGLLI